MRGTSRISSSPTLNILDVRNIAVSDVHRLQLPHTLCWLLKTLNELANQRDRLFRAHEQGKMTADEVLNRFVALMIRVSNDSAALALCDSMPEWFCDHFLAYLENQENGQSKKIEEL